MKAGNRWKDFLGSIRLRLLAAAAVSVGVALLLSGWGLERLFHAHVERRAIAELESDLLKLLRALRFDDKGAMRALRPSLDPREQQPFSGFYWQITWRGKVLERSRSLWDETLQIPDAIAPSSQAQSRIIDGPRGQKLLAAYQSITIRRAAQTVPITVVVAKNAAEVAGAVRAFRGDLVQGLSLLGVALLAALWIALSLGLRPFRELQAGLAALRTGRQSRLAGVYPSEVQPLVNDLNDLLARQEKQVARSKGRAANLAHGLKTPLAAISVLAEELGADESAEAIGRSAGQLLDHVEMMNRQIEHELALARSLESHPGMTPVSLRRTILRLTATLQKLPGGAALKWRTDIADGLALQIDETTLGEILGNLLDNARKWAASTVEISARECDGQIEFLIEDDGPGVPDTLRDQITARGRRLDENQLGSGLGLSIVTEIIDQLQGRFQIGRSRLGGLKASVRLNKPGGDG